jgi:hypothetical protein
MLALSPQRHSSSLSVGGSLFLQQTKLRRRRRRRRRRARRNFSATATSTAAAVSIAVCAAHECADRRKVNLTSAAAAVTDGVEQ